MCAGPWDCMSDVLYSGTRFKTFNVVDDFNRQALAIEVDISLTAKADYSGVRQYCCLERLSRSNSDG